MLVYTKSGRGDFRTVVLSIVEDVTQSKALHRMSDEELMLQFQSGRSEAFNALVNRYSSRLMRYLYRGCGDLMGCEDMIQETFVRVYRNRHSYKQGQAQFANWIYTIAGNLARSRYRKRQRRQTYCSQALNCDCRRGEVDIPDVSVPPDWHLEKEVSSRYIQKALEKIPADFRTVVVLRDIQQLPYDEIAEITGLPMGTVKSRINRGRAKLRNILEDVNPYLSRHAENLGAPWIWVDQIHSEATSEISRKEHDERKQFTFSNSGADPAKIPVWIDHRGERHDLYDLEIEYRAYLRSSFDFGKNQQEDDKSGPTRSVEIDNGKSSLTELVSEFEQRQSKSELARVFNSLTN